MCYLITFLKTSAAEPEPPKAGFLGWSLSKFCPHLIKDPDANDVTTV